jgi:hypothetical protein
MQLSIILRLPNLVSSLVYVFLVYFRRLLSRSQAYLKDQF